MLKAWLTTNDRGCAIISLISFRIMHDILSWPELVFIGKIIYYTYNFIWVSLLKVEFGNAWRMQIMIKWMFIRGVYFICKIFPDIGNIIIELASNFFFARDGLAVHFYFVRSHIVLFRFVK